VLSGNIEDSPFENAKIKDLPGEIPRLDQLPLFQAQLSIFPKEVIEYIT